MSAVAAFVKGKVDESLLKLVQPAGLVPAGVFVLLNLAFVFPQLKSDKVGWVIAFDKLDANWQFVGLALATLGLGYLLLSAGSSVLDLLAGESWRESWLGKRLTARARKGLVGRKGWREIAPGVPAFEDLDEGLDLRTAYPITSTAGVKVGPDDVKEVGPTRLGNALRAGYRRLSERYGIDAASLWSDMEAVVPKDSAARSTLTDARASLDTLVNLAFVLGLFAVEAVLIHSARGNWSAALLSAIALPVAYGFYRTAVPKALAWCDAMSVACDLYRETLRSDLKLRKVTSTDDERDLWHKVSRIFLWGREQELTPDDIYAQPKAAAAPEATIAVSKGLELTHHGERQIDVPATGGAPGEVSGHSIELTLLLSRTDSASADALATIAHVSTPRIPGDPPVTVVPEAVTTPATDVVGDTLVLRLPGLQPDAALAVSVRLPVWEVRVASGLTVAVTPPATGLTYELTVAGTAAAPWVDIFVSATELRPTLRILGATPELRAPASSDNGRHRFTLAGATGAMTIGFHPATLGAT